MSLFQVVTKAVETNKSSGDSPMQQLEEKFATLSLAFKTDRQTLDKRQHIHSRARDVAEVNIQKELDGVKHGLQVLSQLCSTSSERDVLFKTQRHLEVLEQSIGRLSTQAELNGAVHQETRVSEVVDVMILLVENLKRTYKKEHAELEEAKKIMVRSSSLSDDHSSKATNRVSGFKASPRRASIGVISKIPSRPVAPDFRPSDCFVDSRTLDSLLFPSERISNYGEDRRPSPSLADQTDDTCSKKPLPSFSVPGNHISSFISTTSSGLRHVTTDVTEIREALSLDTPNDAIESPTQCSTTPSDDENDTGNILSPAVMAAIAATAAATLGGDAATSGASDFRRPAEYLTTGNMSRGGFRSPRTRALSRVAEMASDDEDQRQPVEDWTPSAPRRRLIRQSSVTRRHNQSTPPPLTSPEPPPPSRWHSVVGNTLALVEAALYWIVESGGQLWNSVAGSPSGRWSALALAVCCVGLGACVVVWIVCSLSRLVDGVFTRRPV